MKPEIKIERILFATDFLENSRLSLDYAVCFAQKFGATIIMLHVVQLSQAAKEAELEISGPSATRKAAEQRLEKLAEGVRRLDIPVDVHVVDGFVCETVIASVRTYRADLLVLGTHGVHRGLDHF
jgi:nucleotide-binding universal stress UspA family protein